MGPFESYRRDLQFETVLFSAFFFYFFQKKNGTFSTQTHQTSYNNSDDDDDNLREVGLPSRNILHRRGVGLKSRIRVTGRVGSLGAL